MDISRRMIFEMKPVLKNPEAALSDDVLYTVERDKKDKFRYDITVIPARTIGGEFAKTFGHYHKKPLPELYEVLSGHAYFFIQKPLDKDTNSANIKEAYVVEAVKGEKAVIPPNFGHLSINVGDEALRLANWVGPTDYDYDTIKKLHGGCYYVLDKGDRIEFEKNLNYKNVPDIIKLKLRDLPNWDIKNDSSHPISDLDQSPEKMDWLLNPEKYSDLLTIDKLYKKI